jgi:acetyl-CoA carboxylase, biotin carboxylase subunit
MAASALGERDCSIQRRHQKLLEEAPSPALTADQRKKLLRTAVRRPRPSATSTPARSSSCSTNAGEFYFMEMNTRIQVEHPVTEEVAGVDLVKEQIRIAYGEKLSFTQRDVEPKGHAIEFRVNAENPYRQFTPSPGRVEFVHFPGGRGVRVDSHVYNGYEISPHYDSMIAKIICRGKDRREAIALTARALSEFHLEGVDTTAPLGLALMADARFVKGEYNTAFLEHFMQDSFLIKP